MGIGEFSKELKQMTGYSNCDHIAFSSLRDPLSFEVTEFVFDGKEFKINNMDSVIEIKHAITQLLSENKDLFFFDLEKKEVWTQFEVAHDKIIAEKLQNISWTYKGETAPAEIENIVIDAFVKLQKKHLNPSLDQTDCILM